MCIHGTNSVQGNYSAGNYNWAASRENVRSAIFGENDFCEFLAGFDLEKHEAENRLQKSLPACELRQFKRRSFTTKNFWNERTYFEPSFSVIT